MEEKTQAQKILDAAYNCISSKGYANVSLREIADEAGVVLSQLNYYFGNKEGLFAEVIKIMINKYMKEIVKALRKGESAKEKLLSIINFFREMLKNNPELFRMLYDLTGLSIWSTSFNDLLKELFNGISELIEENILSKTTLNGSLKGYSSKSIARMILGAMFGTAIPDSIGT
ncbi:TetR/AcrR family transcriptional regulator [Thermoanaerobacterium sp. RBIITD]|uniref:TetR/AcrR family transcriptional regulator n=1 Tax=Thermoanaerobacterium sp. RBIITD TaxID=1550240 RepID=UPI000BC00765|nr:TetR/AcrR family transcriptional regulator [Thermoanaerobacterium sp. RBIITD]SNX53918.1 transcriptional regulator, TetR family [Thermoanaerobacterium sp. RBIITD]